MENFVQTLRADLNLPSFPIIQVFVSMFKDGNRAPKVPAKRPTWRNISSKLSNGQVRLINNWKELRDFYRYT